jgi:transcriptional regulator with XRE-family HTH domain
MFSTDAKAETLQLGTKLRRLRAGKRWTIQQLATMSSVSRSIISKIERGEASPTTVVLGKLAEGFWVSISQLIWGCKARSARLLRPHDQPIYRESKSGFERRSLSPVSRHNGVDVILNTLPVGGSTGPFPSHRGGVEEHLYVIRGRLIVTLGRKRFRLEAGDALFFSASLIHRVDNSGEIQADYLIVIDNTALV